MDSLAGARWKTCMGAVKPTSRAQKRLAVASGGMSERQAAFQSSLRSGTHDAPTVKSRCGESALSRGVSVIGQGLYLSAKLKRSDI